MSDTVDFRAAKPSNLFVVRWTLTLALPALLLAACQLSIAILLPEVLMYLVAMVLPFGAWLLIAFLQFRLLRSHFRRPRLWLVATLAGGIVGNVAAGFAQLHSQSAIDNAIMNGEDASAWASSIYLYIPGFYAAIANAAIVNMAQTACLNSRMGERLPWFLVSIAAAMFGIHRHVHERAADPPRAAARANARGSIRLASVFALFQVVPYGLSSCATPNASSTPSSGSSNNRQQARGQRK